MTAYASLFQLVFDMGNASCYTSGQTVTNLGTSLTTNDFYRGLNSTDTTRTPTFNGTPGALDRTCFFSSASPGGKILSPVGTPDILTTAHQAGGAFTIIHGGFLPASLANNNYPLATCLGEGAGQGPGTFLRIPSNFNWTVGVEGDGGSGAFSRASDAPLLPNSFFTIGCGIQDGNNRSWMYTSSFLNPNNPAPSLFEHFSDTFNPVFSSPSANPAQSIAYIWQNGATGTVRSNTGMEGMFWLVANSFIAPQVALPLMRTLFRRQQLNLP